jgi:hypothetical protein
MNEETAGILLEDILGRVQNNDFFKAIITKALKSRKDEKLKEEKAGLTERGLKQKTLWNKEWDDVIDCALVKREKSYGRNYRKEIRDIWLHNIVRISPGFLPVIRKKEVWAAVLEYLFCQSHQIQITHKQLADKYSISKSAVNNRLKWVEDNLQEGSKDE